MNRLAFSVLRGVVALTCFVTSIVSLAQVTSDFASNADGWTAFDYNAGSSTAVTYNAAGGNPGGYVSFSPAGANNNIYFTAPSKFNGNFSFSYNQNLTFDLKVSQTGVDSPLGDVLISGPAGTIYHQLSAYPVTGAWTSYSMNLNETQGWHFSCYTCAAPTKTQMKAILQNVTKIQIRVKYITGAGAYTGQLDNVVLNSISLTPPPAVTFLTPAFAVQGTPVTIIGSNFNSTPSLNLVYFNGVKATPTSGTTTQLTVAVPKSAAFGPITVVDLSTGLQGSSTMAFSPLFDNNSDNGGQIIPASLRPGYNTILPMSNSGNTYSGMDKGDLDGDGWIDLVADESFSTTIYAFRNLGSGGTVSTASFATAVTLSVSTVPGGSPSLGPVTVADVDNDGMPDISAVTASGAGQGYIAVFRNTSTPGTLSFSAPQFFAYPYYSAQLYMGASDVDGDGRIDFAVTTGTAPGGIWIIQNMSTPGTVDFAYGVAIGTNASHSGVRFADLNNDRKPEMIASRGVSFEIYQNNSTPGIISMGAPFNVTATNATYFTVADLDADNRMDIVYSAYSAPNIYFLPNSYTGPTLDASAFGSEFSITNKVSNPDGFAVHDINADGKPDIVIVGSSDVGVMENVGNPGTLGATSFLPPTLFQGSASSSFLYGLGPVVADLDGDNKGEVAFVYSNNAVPAGEKGIYVFHNESFPVPAITNLSPPFGNVATSVDLNGDLMATGSTAPSVRLNKIKAPVTGSPTNALTTVTNPAGTISGKFQVTNHGLSGTSRYFTSTFVTNRTIDASSLGPGVDFPLSANTRDAIEVADFDDDGKMDVVVVDNYSTTKIFQNAATAGQPITATSLTELGTTYTAGYNIVALDIDGDGKMDLHNGYGLLQNNGAGTVSFLSGPNGIYTNTGGFNYAAIADFNKDGKIDMAQVNGGANIQVYENRSVNGPYTYNGNLSTFNITATSLARPNNYGGIVAEDFDGDGYEDIIVTNQTAANMTFYLNNKIYGPISASSFSFLGNYSTSGSQPIGLTANDFDRDGKIDIAVAYFNSTFVSVYRNISSIGDISFAAPVDIVAQNKGYNIASQDLDGDGKPEIVVIYQPNPGTGAFSIYKNTSPLGSVSFGAKVDMPLTRKPQSLAFADINLDQKPDILIVGFGGSAPANALMVFENKIPVNVITITSQPSDFSACEGDVATFTTGASGTTNLTFQWQFSPDGIVPFADIPNGANYSNVTTATLSVNTTGSFGAGRYRCKVNGDFANAAYTNDEGLFINPAPSAPTVLGASGCPSAMVLTASGGSNGQYRWYSVPTGGTPIAGETNSTYTTPTLSVTTDYYVSIASGGCESNRTAVTATINACNPPVIETESLATIIGGKITIDLKPLITTANLDLSSLQIVTPPSSGAVASIDANGILTIDYVGKVFSGDEQISIEACDLNGQCSTQDFTIEVGGDIIVYNGISPNGKNPKLIIQFIEVLPDTKNNTVYIFDRWENQVWHGTNYDNSSVVFTGVSDSGSDLPTGVYYYKIEFASGLKTKTGFISLRRQ